MRTSRAKGTGTDLHRNRMALAACLVMTASFVASSCADGGPAGNAGPEGDPAPTAEWTYYGGQNSFNRYSPLAQIDADNVASLEIAWQRPGIDSQLQEEFPELAFNNYLRGTPILVGGTLYAPNAVGLVEAFDPGTGKTRWVQRAASLEDARGRSFRGVAYWNGEGAEDLRADNGHAGGRIISVRGSWLHALDAETGKPVSSFGDGGSVNLVPEGRDRFNWSSGPIVVGDVIVIAGTVDGAGDSGTEWRDSAPEDVRGFDARTGELVWTFHVIPREGEFGADTWGDGSRELSGDVGSWCCLSADDDLGIVYVPLGAPTSAYYGGHRPGDNLFANSLVALDGATGERLWHFQMVHHDIWEYDTLGPPVLGRINVDGRAIDAVMQASKTGFLFTFDRRTGEPVWPIEEKAVPQSKVPGEATSPTQPFPSKPPAFDRQGVSEKDVIDFTPEIHKRALALADSLVMGPLFTPPMEEGSIEGKIGTYVVPGAWGAGNWHTGAFDPQTGTYYAVSLTLAQRLAPVQDGRTGRDGVRDPGRMAAGGDRRTTPGQAAVGPDHGHRHEPGRASLDGAQRRRPQRSSPARGSGSAPARQREPPGAAAHGDPALHRRGKRRGHRHPRYPLGHRVPGLRQGDGQGGVGDGPPVRHDRRAHDLHARGQAVHRGRRRRQRTPRGIRRAGSAVTRLASELAHEDDLRDEFVAGLARHRLLRQVDERAHLGRRRPSQVHDDVRVPVEDLGVAAGVTP